MRGELSIFNRPGKPQMKWWHVEVRFNRQLSRGEVNFIRRSFKVSVDESCDIHLGQDGIVGCWGEKWPSQNEDGERVLQALRGLPPSRVRSWPIGSRCPHPLVDGDWGPCELGQQCCSAGDTLCEAAEPWIYIDARSTYRYIHRENTSATPVYI